ncbi:MAG: DUF2970 domain-containing protein [Gammaproteobacteria bacterium TMED57]|jgi:hypothetical protein|nr:MAG: DUF2970 domain-containing protein [Gammaproteobacteria bacterium TMED57]|tara:strand:- start:711 stop:980 length:270 start_codon:yes stop_codon:yes gene_type:complete
MSDTTQDKPADDTDDLASSQEVDNDQPLTLRQMFGSAISAMIGVQSKEKRERDFARGKASHFIIVGVVLTAIFVLTMAGVVSLVLSFVT